MPPASPVPGWASGEVCTESTATRRGRSNAERTQTCLHLRSSRLVCGFIRDTPSRPYQYAQSPRLRASAGDKCCTDAIKKTLRSVVEYPARQPNVYPAELGEQLVSLNVPCPALRIGPVMRA